MRSIPVLMAVAALAACSDTNPDESALKAQFTPLNTERAFIEKVAGRNWQSDVIRVTFSADGTLSGTINGVPGSGTWVWEDTLFCSAFRISDSGGQDCSELRLRDRELLVVPLRGTGAPFVYTEVR